MFSDGMAYSEDPDHTANSLRDLSLHDLSLPMCPNI